MLFVVTLHASCLVWNTSFLIFMHAPSKSSQQHEKNASQNMRKGQNLQTTPSKPCIKKSPTSFKKPDSYIFQGSYEESQLPSRSSLFLGSNPPSNGLKSSKNPFFRHNISQKSLLYSLKPIFSKNYIVSPLGPCMFPLKLVICKLMWPSTNPWISSSP